MGQFGTAPVHSRSAPSERTLNEISVEFLTRAGCHLCAEAVPAVRRAARWSGMRVVEIDIDSDDDLVRDYGMRIPVVRFGDEVVAEGRVDAVALWRKLVALRFSRNGGS